MSELQYEVFLTGGPLNGNTIVLDQDVTTYTDPAYPNDLYTRAKVGMARGTVEVMCHSSVAAGTVVDTLLGV